MRIAYLCPDFANPAGGPLSSRARVGGLVRSLVRLGHDVTVLTPMGGAEALGTDLPVQELRVEPFEERTTELLEADPNLGPEAASEARALYSTVLRHRSDAPIRDFQPDVVIERSSLFGGAGLTIARKAGIPVIVDVVAPVVDPGATGRTRLRPSWIRNADQLLAATPQLAGWLGSVARDPERIHLVTGGVEPEPFETAVAERDALRERLELPEVELIGYVGALDARHDLEPLLLAMGLIDRQGIDPHLLLVGDGPQREALEKVVRAIGLAELVTFAGDVPADAVPAYIAALDVAVAPSDEESIDLLGYFAASRPVAAPDTEGHHCLEGGKTAWFYPPSDPGALAITIGMILRNPLWAAELAEAGREHVREHHSWEQSALDLIALTGSGDVAIAS